MHRMTGSITVPRLPVRFIAVATAHVGLFYILTDALRFEAGPDVERLTVVPVPDDERPRIPEPEFKEPDVDRRISVSPERPPVPRYETETEANPPLTTRAAGGITERAGGTAEVVSRFVPVRAEQPLTRAPYPPGAIRGNQEGIVELAIYVLRNGRIAEVKVSKSSGHPLLDRAAVEEARRHWRLQPALRGDEPVEAWGSFRVVFRLGER